MDSFINYSESNNRRLVFNRNMHPMKVYEGHCAVKVGKHWVGVTPTTWSTKKRRTAQKALDDCVKTISKWNNGNEQTRTI